VAGRDEAIPPHVVRVAVLVLSDGDEEVDAVPRSLLLASRTPRGFDCRNSQPGPCEVLAIAVLQVLEDRALIGTP
jgi:hypothetical protein